MKALIASIATAVLLAWEVPAEAGDVAAGRSRAAAACASCHGLDGIGREARHPNLAGQQKGYLIKQLQAFRDGTRKDPFMSPMARPLTESDIRNLAAYYSSLER
jgi:cytochrome c553